MTTLVEDPILIRCGEVEGAVFDVVNGVPTPHDPIAIGELALPAAAFSDESLAAMELIRGVGGEACFSAQVGSDGVPVISAQLARQCLRPRGGGRELLPASPGGGPEGRGRGAGEGPGHRAPDGPGGRTVRQSEVVKPPNRRRR